MVAKLDGTNGLLQQYDYQAPSTGFSYTFAAGVNVLVMNPAGTLATGTITMPASPADGMTISFSSTQTITALTVNANTGQSIVRKPTSFGAGSAMTFVYRLSNTTWYPMTNYATAGTVLQVVSSTKTDTASTNSQTYVDTGLSVAITPTSSSSKILILISINVSHSDFGVKRMYFRVSGGNSFANYVGGSGASGHTDSFAVCHRAGDVYSMVTASGTYLDSPATTSSTTYKLQWSVETTASTAYLNRPATEDANGSRTASTITVMEIAA
jgi:hypothetical protein